MFERFDADARRAVVEAQEWARRQCSPEITTDHLTCALLSKPETNAGQALVSLGADPIVLGTTVAGTLASGTIAPEGHIPFTSGVKAVIRRSLRTALDLHDDYIGTEHLVLAVLVAASSTVGAQTMQAAGITDTSFADTVRNLPGRARVGAAPHPDSPPLTASPVAAGALPPAKGSKWRHRRTANAAPPPPPPPRPGSRGSGTSASVTAALIALLRERKWEELLAKADRLLSTGLLDATTYAQVRALAGIAIAAIPRPERFDEADEWLEASMDQPGLRLAVLDARAGLLSRIGRRTEARSLVDQAIAEGSTGDRPARLRREARVRASSTEAEIGEAVDELLAELENGSALEPVDRARSLGLAAWTIAVGMVRGRFDEALRLADEALRLAPDAPSTPVAELTLEARLILDARAAILTVTGRGVEAIDRLRASIDAGTPMPDATLGVRHALLSIALFDSGDTEGARRQAEEAQRLGADRPVLAEAWRRIDDAAGTWLPPGPSS